MLRYTKYKKTSLWQLPIVSSVFKANLLSTPVYITYMFCILLSTLSVTFNCVPWAWIRLFLHGIPAGLILHGGNGGNEGDCLRVPWSLPWCPWNAPVQICNFIIGCPLPRRKCLGALALSKTKLTALYQGLLLQWLASGTNYCSLSFH